MQEAMREILFALMVIPAAAVAISRIVQLWKMKIAPKTYDTLEIKPLDCAFCLSFWINVFYYHEGSIFEMALIWFTSMIVASAMDKLLDRI